MISINDFRKEDGQIDWVKYNQAEINAGERCSLCHSLMMFSNGVPRLCGQCMDISKGEEFSHDNFIRCPKCGETENTSNDNYELFSDGEHDVTCSSCGYDYEIQTSVSYSFKSPELLNGQKEGGEK